MIFLLKNKYDVLLKQIQKERFQHFPTFVAMKIMQDSEKTIEYYNQMYPALVATSHLIYEAFLEFGYHDAFSAFSELYRQGIDLSDFLNDTEQNYREALRVLYFDAICKKMNFHFLPIPTQEIEIAKNNGLSFEQLYRSYLEDFVVTMPDEVVKKCFLSGDDALSLSQEDCDMIEKEHRRYIQENVYPNVDVYHTTLPETVSVLKKAKIKK